VAHLWEQNSLRFLGTLRVLDESPTRPAVFLSAGVQEIGTGNPGYAAVAEKNWNVGGGTLNTYGGVGARANEDHVHPVGGLKYSLDNGWSFGLQHDGHRGHPFVTLTRGQWTGGFYLLGGRDPAYMIGHRF
jgi:hypothetical protein